jgi:TonB family protein
MFNNLIESSSHNREFKRRGSFFLFTVATYALLFVIAGVASIYAYDAHLEDQNLEIVTMMSPADFPIQEQPQVRQSQPARDTGRTASVDERQVAMASVNRPEVPPSTISAVPNVHLPVREGVPFMVTGRDRNADVGSGVRVGPGSGGTGTGPTVVEVEIPPPPVPEEKPKPRVISKGVITSEAVSLPKPGYPLMAKQMRLQGKVSVQVLIDETGKVISARAIEGHPLFRQASEAAAFQARFSPTKLSDQPVKVSGVITYNFVLQ